MRPHHDLRPRLSRRARRGTKSCRGVFGLPSVDGFALGGAIWRAALCSARHGRALKGEPVLRDQAVNVPIQRGDRAASPAISWMTGARPGRRSSGSVDGALRRKLAYGDACALALPDPADMISEDRARPHEGRLGYEAQRTQPGVQQDGDEAPQERWLRMRRLDSGHFAVSRQCDGRDWVRRHARHCRASGNCIHNWQGARASRSAVR